MLSNYVKLVIRYSHNIAFREKKNCVKKEIQRLNYQNYKIESWQAFLKIPMKISFLTLFNVITRMWKFNIRGSNHPVICGQGLKLFDSITEENKMINFSIRLFINYINIHTYSIS